MSSPRLQVVFVILVCYINYNIASAPPEISDDSHPGEPEPKRNDRHPRCINTLDVEGGNSLSNRAPPIGLELPSKYLQSDQQRVWLPPWRNHRDDHPRGPRSPETRDLDYHEEYKEGGVEEKGKKTTTTPRVIVTVYPPYRQRFPARKNQPNYPSGSNSNYRPN